MSTQLFDNIFTVQSVPKIYSTDVRFNILKHREHIAYKTSSTIDNINLSYVVNTEVNSDNALSVVDKSREFLSNNLPNKLVETIFHGKTYSIHTNRFMITDQFLLNPNGTKLPLYYKHVLENFDLSNTDNYISNIAILDSVFKETSNLEIQIDKKSGVVFNNLQNKFDPTSGDYTVYYVRYSVTDKNTLVTKPYIEILNNIFTYNQATFDDIDSHGFINPSNKVYTVDQLTSNIYEVTLQVVGFYAIKEQENSIIRILKPSQTDINNPWFISVTNGSFYATIPITSTNSNIFYYSIKEYGTQLFDPYEPYKYVADELSTRISSNLIKVANNNIFQDPTNGFYLFLVITGLNGKIKSAISNDPSKINTYYKGTLITNSIRSLDSSNGIIDITSSILDTDKINVSYFYEEKEYEVFDVDFNPISNIDILGKRIVFYVVPTTNNNRSIYFLTVDRTGLVLATSQTNNPDLITDINTNQFYYELPSLNLTLPPGPPFFVTVPLYHLNFIDKYTVQVNSNFTFANATNPKYLILGDVYTSSPADPQESVLFDIREHGGGIKNTPGLLDKLVQLAPEAQWITDNGLLEGLSYPGTASFICEVPVKIQKENGGLFTDNNIRQIIERHMATGHYPLVRGYSSQIQFSAEPITNGLNVSIKLNWRSYGSVNSYNIYISTYLDHSFVKINDTPITDNSSGNTYTISSNLARPQLYWIYIVPVQNNQELYESVIGPTDRLTYQNLNKIAVKTY